MYKICLLLLLVGLPIQAQICPDDRYRFIQLDLKFDDKKLELGKTYISQKHDTLSISKVKFYISGITINYKDQSTYTKPNSYHLVDLAYSQSLLIPFLRKPNSTIESIQFNLGVDKAASTSGAMGGDLDATNGMYWAWQSGYINLKIEGKSKSCKTRKNKFQFHIGGYEVPNYTMRTIVVKTNNLQDSSTPIGLTMDLGRLFDTMSLKETHSIMIPGQQAMEFADWTTQIFFIH